MKTLPLAVALCLPLVAAAQDAAVPAPEKLRFDAVSIKVNRTPVGSGPIGLSAAPGRFQAVGVPLAIVILTAFEIRGIDQQLIGLPEWASQERYDILATTGGQRSQQEIAAMLRSMLDERFRIVTHTELRDAPSYNLVLARSDGRPGPDLTPSTKDCDAYNRTLAEERMAEAKKAQAAGQIPAPVLVTAGARCSPGFSPMRGSGMTVKFEGLSLASIAARLRTYAGRTVIDRTGLTGTYDATLRFTPDYAAMSRGALIFRPIAPPPLPVNSALDDAPPLEAALREQLGLKFETQPGTMEVLVIDRLEKPTED
jgi:uncharacterized protein (TIGR03435 family)